MKLFDITDTPEYKNDKRFISEQERDTYYHSTYWLGCDYIIKNGIFYPARQPKTGPNMSNLYIRNYKTSGLTENDEKRIVAFFEGKREAFIELSQLPKNEGKSKFKLITAPLSIMYTGDEEEQGGWWILKK